MRSDKGGNTERRRAIFHSCFTQVVSGADEAVLGNALGGDEREGEGAGGEVGLLGEREGEEGALGVTRTLRGEGNGRERDGVEEGG